jgi:hypothetical protein
VLEGGIGLIDEGLHADLLVVRRKGRVEERALEA